MVLLRQIIGETLRDLRQAQHRTLRDVAAAASVSLGYLSEVERGQKEPSSELLSSICEALDIPLSVMLDRVSREVAAEEDFAYRAALPLRKVARIDERRKVAELAAPAEPATDGENDTATQPLTPPTSLVQARARRARAHRWARSAEPSARLAA